MTVPDSVGGVVCDVAAVAAIIDDLMSHRKDGSGWQLYGRARTTGTTLAVPAIVVSKAAVLHLDSRGRRLLGALVAPQLGRRN